MLARILFCKTHGKMKISASPSLLCITSRFLCTPTTQKARYPYPDQPNSAYYDDLVSDAGRARDFKTLHHLLNKRNKDGCFNTGNTFNFITNYDDDLSILDTLTETISNLDKGFARKGAFDALIARLCRLNQIQRSLRIVEVMIHGNHGINACTFHPIVSTLTRKKKMEEAHRVLALMRETRISPDVASYNYLLTAYCVKGDLSAAVGVLTEIREEKIEADSRTYDAMVLGACKAGKIEGGLAMLRRMEEEGVPALYSTHAHVINGLVRLEYFAQAVEFVLSVAGKDKALDAQNFGHLGKYLMKRRRFEEAKLIFGKMDKRGLVMGDKLREDYHSLM
ncbi:pentatricopeptide repeat-containing protein At2g40240, mitochondrial [Telopea speciosissima]|uniref:pentatricopeptide repeat-containing protein At2g40240, mitochondrial n=1 Tax=Telopea speciosissima TaxID=54955 RepID=UPI001CC49E36|nr:pentatricopeptide repeat-containing protein At2g40240, mitochondrial [Telopea speciosissima]